MRGVLTYTGLFLVAAVVLQLFVFDSVRVSIWFNPLAYIAFIVLLPVNMRTVAVLFLGFLTGAFMDFFEGTAGLHTAATLATAFVRRGIMTVILGRETVEEQVSMPSANTLGAGKFLRYAALAVALHCLVYFSLEALTWTNYDRVLVKTAVSGAFTLLAVWVVSMLFTVKTQNKA
jgi:hypothetical protein